MSKLEERKYKDVDGYRIYDDGRFQKLETGLFYKPQIIRCSQSPVYAKYKYIQKLEGSVKEMVYKNFVGDIPRGWKVINIDGDYMNNKVENLMLIHVISKSIEEAKSIEDIIGIHYRKSLGKLWVSHVNTKPRIQVINGVAKKIYPAMCYPGTRCEKTAIKRHKWIAQYHKENGVYPPQYLFNKQFKMYGDIEQFTLKAWEEEYIPRDFLADKIGHCNFKECTKSEACYSVMHRTRTPLKDPKRPAEKWRYKQHTTFYKDNEVFAAY